MARFCDIRPQAVVRCRTAADVAETIAFATRVRLPTATRSGGHCFAGRSSTEGIVIDVAPMSSAEVSDGVVTVGAGARLADLYDALDEHGVTIPAGCGPAVGIAGLTLGGGLGILGRKHGLTCDHLLAAQIVLADGRVVECDEHHDAELFWALRGAGAGNFGVVTALVFRTLPAPATTIFHLVWPQAHAAAVIDAWQSWAPSGPDELNASLRLAAFGDTDEPPVVNVFGALLGRETEVVQLLDRLVVLSGEDPAAAAHAHQPFREAKRSLVGLGAPEEAQPELPIHQFSKSEFFRQALPRDAIAGLVDGLSHGRAPGHAREVTLTPMGGAYNRVPAHATAFVHRDERFVLEHVLVIDPDAPSAGQDAGRQWVARSWSSVHPWGSGGVYPNFPDPDLADPGHAYHGSNLDRLRRAKARYDPANVFRFHQSLRA
jgi:FAD/FMN-containing dehydrogenase